MHQDYEADLKSLNRMLEDFEKDRGLMASSPTSDTHSMALVMEKYESQLRNPLRNLLVGDLARAMLIQVRAPLAAPLPDLPSPLLAASLSSLFQSVHTFPPTPFAPGSAAEAGH